MVRSRCCQCVSLVGIVLLVSNVFGLPCNLPESVLNGELVYGPNYNYEDYLASDPNKSNPGEIISIVCDYGFEQLSGGGDGDSTCRDTGSWDPPISSCSRKGDNPTTATSATTCSIPLVANGEVTKSGNVLHSGKIVPLGTFVEVSCNTGFLLDGDAVITCQVDGHWQSGIPSCLVADTGNIKCQVPDIPQSRIKLLHNIVNENHQVDPGSEISVGCSPGHRREGEKYLRCLINGSWSHAIPKCTSSFFTAAQPTACKLPTILNGAYHVAEAGGDDYGGGDYGGGDYGGAGGDAYDSYDSGFGTTRPPSKSHASDIRELALGSSIEVKCDNGFEIVGSKHVNCELDGTLSNVPLCISDSGTGTANKCHVPRINGGRIKLLHDDIFPGTPVDINKTITISCDVLMDREGEELLTCLANGTWNHPTPVCKLKPVDPFTPCLLLPIDNGGYELPTTSSPAMTDSAGGGLDYGDDYADHGGSPAFLTRGLNMTVFCNEGYRLIGSPTVRCYHHNVTLSAVPTCELVQCVVQKILNGSMKMGNIVAPSVVDFNDTLAASCDEGFTLIGDDRLTCGEKQEFDEEFPKCINGSVFCTIPTIENGRPSFLRPGLNLASLDTVKIVCNRGYTTPTSSPVIKCGVSGDWLPKVPKCLIVRCNVDSIITDGRLLVNGRLAPSTIQYGENITVICDQGFRTFSGGQDSLQCREDGKLSAKLPRCEPENKSNCRVSLMKDNHTIIDTDLNVLRSGRSVKMSCIQGFVSNIDRDELNCDAGVWRQRMPVCIKDNKCTLPKIKHGRIELTTVRRNMDHHILVNDTADVKCNVGYILDGQQQLKCVAVEKYKDPLPVCKAVDTGGHCISPDVGHGELVDVDGNVISPGDRFIVPNTKIFLKCPASDEVVMGNSEAKCLKTGSWDKALYTCVKAPESFSVSNMEHKYAGIADHTLYIVIGAVIAALIIIPIIVAVMLHKRRKQQMLDIAPIMDNNGIDNMTYMTSPNAKSFVKRSSNGQSNSGKNPDDAYMRPQNGRSRLSDDVVMRRSHVRDSVAADYENERPASVITFKPAYDRQSSRQMTELMDNDTKV